jgi:RecA-family ATPase
LEAQSTLWPEPITIREFDLKPVTTQRWLWDAALSFASTSQIVGAPRHGKSTFAFNLALAISRGADFLNRKTTRCPVLYVSIDNSEDEIRDIKSRLGCLGEENFYLHIGDVPGDPLPGLYSMIEKYKIKFVVIDTYLRFFRLKELKNEEIANSES